MTVLIMRSHVPRKVSSILNTVNRFGPSKADELPHLNVVYMFGRSLQTRAMKIQYGFIARTICKKAASRILRTDFTGREERDCPFSVADRRWLLCRSPTDSPLIRWLLFVVTTNSWKEMDDEAWHAAANSVAQKAQLRVIHEYTWRQSAVV